MRSVHEIEKEQIELEKQLETIQGTATEVYTRIVGYYRSVNNWNRGKREEYDHRLLFNQPRKTPRIFDGETQEASEVLKNIDSLDESFAPARYILFYRNACPNCPPVKAYLENCALDHEHINVDTNDGTEAASKFQVFAAPTVIFFDQYDKEIARVHNVSGLKELEIPQGVV